MSLSGVTFILFMTRESSQWSLIYNVFEIDCLENVKERLKTENQKNENECLYVVDTLFTYILIHRWANRHARSRSISICWMRSHGDKFVTSIVRLYLLTRLVQMHYLPHVCQVEFNLNLHQLTLTHTWIDIKWLFSF